TDHGPPRPGRLPVPGHHPGELPLNLRRHRPPPRLLRRGHPRHTHHTPPPDASEPEPSEAGAPEVGAPANGTASTRAIRSAAKVTSVTGHNGSKSGGELRVTPDHTHHHHHNTPPRGRHSTSCLSPGANACPRGSSESGSPAGLR